MKRLLIVTVLMLFALLSFSMVGSQASEDGSQTFTVFYGGFGPGNVAVYAFTPNDLKIHRGDTVTWILDAETNVHFEEEFVRLFTGAEVDGQQMAIFNPDAAIPSIESGDTYTGGEVNTGALGLISLDHGLRSFSMVMDLEPGTYTYFSDIHVRTGTITVVPDDETIPSPSEVSEMTALSLEHAFEVGAEAYADMQVEMAMQMDMSENRIMVGLRAGDGDVYVRQFFPEVLVIDVGESVTWEVPEGNRDSHTITWPPLGLGKLVEAYDLEADPPIYTLGPTLIPLTEDGATIGLDTPIHTVIGDGQTFTLTFEEAGVYPYVDNLHAPGMEGVVVVMPETD